MSDLVPATRDRATGRGLHPNRVSIWPVETGGFGIDFTYHGATGYTDAEFAEQVLQAGGLKIRAGVDTFGPVETWRGPAEAGHH